jgi:membrane-bound lytic murein transglycosylase D
MLEASMKNDKKIYHVIYLLTTFSIFSITAVIFSFTDTEEEKQQLTRNFRKDYAIFAVDIPKDLSFAGEKVPLENMDVRESFDRELLVNTYWQSQTLLFIKRANKYFPVIEEILRQNNIPDDFKYITLAESGLQNVVSPAGAVGFWQLLSGTAKDYGLEVNNEVDERYHIEKATEAACKFFKESYGKFGTWTMAAASYNVGRGGLNRQVVRQQEANYYNLLLNIETGRYMYRVLAIKTILENPNKYGFYYEDKDLYQPIHFYKVEIDSSIIDFAAFAKNHNTNYKILKYLNPWLRDKYLTNSYKKTYQIKIPKEGSRQFIPQDELTLQSSLK